MNTWLRRLGAFLLAVLRRLAPGKRARINNEMDGVALPGSGADIKDDAGSALVTGTCDMVHESREGAPGVRSGAQIESLTPTKDAALETFEEPNWGDDHAPDHDLDTHEPPRADATFQDEPGEQSIGHVDRSSDSSVEPVSENVPPDGEFDAEEVRADVAAKGELGPPATAEKAHPSESQVATSLSADETRDESMPADIAALDSADPGNGGAAKHDSEAVEEHRSDTPLSRIDRQSAQEEQIEHSVPEPRALEHSSEVVDQSNEPCGLDLDVAKPSQEISPSSRDSTPLVPPEPEVTEVATHVGASPSGTIQSAPQELEWDAFSERAKPDPDPAATATEEDENEEDDGWPDGSTQGTRAPSEPRREQKSRAPIDCSECLPAAEEKATLPDEYLYWNRILAARFINSPPRSTIHLATSPRLLAGVLSENKGEKVQPPDAEARFVEAVREAYYASIADSRSGLRILRRRESASGLPLCVGFLALSVLAAHKMHSDGANSSSAYYVRLKDLLATPADPNDLPKGFATLEFEALWNFLAAWLAANTSLSLALPAAGAQKRYIGYPLAHVPLRQLDLEKLPAFFIRADYSPGSSVSPERIEDDFRRWANSYGMLSQAGREALEDNRAPAVLAQIRSELRLWDGSVFDTHGVQSMQVEVLLENIRRRSRISLLAPRREGYPEVFRCGEVEMAGTQDWYDPVELTPTDGPLLEHGFTWPADGDPSRVLRRPAGEVIVLAPNADYSELVSRTQIPKDVSCAILCHERVAARVGLYLGTIGNGAMRPLVEGNCPQDWRLFLRVRAVRVPASIPEDFWMLDVVSETDIIPQGGLRLGRWAWMQGAPPSLLVEGRDGRAVSINDTPVDADEDGHLHADDMLTEPGSYTVRVGYLERTIRIVPAVLRQLGGAASTGAEPRASWPIMLETGCWTLIGRKPGEAHRAPNSSGRPSLFQCAFRPVWAVSVHAGPGARVIQLSAEAAECSWPVQRDAQSQAWVSSIYEASIRHAVPESKLASGSEALSQAWADYAALAKAIKRQWKKTR